MLRRSLSMTGICTLHVIITADDFVIIWSAEGGAPYSINGNAVNGGMGRPIPYKFVKFIRCS